MNNGHKNYLESLVGLIFHLAGTFAIFVIFMMFGWLANCAIHFLDSISPFPSEVLWLVKKLEIGLVYVDAALCLFVLIGGAFKFLKGP